MAFSSKGLQYVDISTVSFAPGAPNDSSLIALASGQPAKLRGEEKEIEKETRQECWGFSASIHWSVVGSHALYETHFFGEDAKLPKSMGIFEGFPGFPEKLVHLFGDW